MDYVEILSLRGLRIELTAIWYGSSLVQSHLLALHFTVIYRKSRMSYLLEPGKLMKKTDPYESG